MTLTEITLSGLGTDRTFFCRHGTSDINMASQVFRDGAYNLRTLKRWPDIDRWLTANQRPLIVDAGANIGAASVYFALMHPRVQIVALEPEASNYALLRKNTEGLDVRCVLAALAAAPGYVSVYHPMGEPQPHCGHAGFRTQAAEEGIAAVTLPGALGLLAGQPFLAKIDIEGAEADVFASNTSWIERFPIVIVELHDWLYPGQRLGQSFLRAIAPLDRDFVIMGEHIVSLSNRLLVPTE